MTNAKTPKSASRYRLPDPPQREPDEMTSVDQLHQPGNTHHLAQHFGKPDTTLVTAERWIAREPHSSDISRRRPDLLIAFDADPAAYEASNGYIITEQGKPPDFVLEVASESTADVDTGAKREQYAALGIPEYWRFDKTGQYHGTRLAGDRLVGVGGAYEPIPIEELPDGTLQGYSKVLNLNIRWEQRQLTWYDPATDRHIVTYDNLREALIQEQARADAEHEALIQEQVAPRQSTKLAY